MNVQNAEERRVLSGYLYFLLISIATTEKSLESVSNQDD